jgi:hypothetical protein
MSASASYRFVDVCTTKTATINAMTVTEMISKRWLRTACQYGTRPAPVSGFPLSSPSPRRRLQCHHLILSKLADLATVPRAGGALVGVARSAERDAVTDDGTDPERDSNPAKEADTQDVRPVHCADHPAKSKQAHRLEWVI